MVYSSPASFHGSISLGAPRLVTRRQERPSFDSSLPGFAVFHSARAEQLNAARREFAMLMHPDKGVEMPGLAALNDGCDRLRVRLGG